MGVPYSDTIANVLGGHAKVKHGGSWRSVEDVQVKSGGTWRDTKEVYVKHSGSWRKVHEGEHYLFAHTISSNQQSEFNLANWISGQGYGGSLIKGHLYINATVQRVHLGSFSGSSKVYFQLSSGARVIGRGGNGGNRGGQNGQGGQTSVYSGGTPFVLNNAGIISGGGGGGGGGQNAQCTYQNTYYYGCMKGQQCSGTNQQFSQALGGGGGGGAGYPGGQGKHGGSNGGLYGGGGGGGNGGCGSISGGGGGNIGNGGCNASGGSGGGSGTGIQGINHRYSQLGSNDGDIRGGTSNT